MRILVMCVHMIIFPFCEEAFEDNVDENTVNTEDASNSGNEKIEIEIRGDVKKTVHTDFCEEAFKGNADEDIVNTEDASNSGNEKIEVDIRVDVLMLATDENENDVEVKELFEHDKS